MTTSPTDGNDPERELLLGLRRGDEAAYEQLVTVETGHLLAVARRVLRNEEDARDAVQQAFLAAFRALPEFNGDCRLTTWLHRIVLNTALMKVRSRKRRPEESIDDLLPRFQADGHHVEQFYDWSLSADAALDRSRTRASVRDAIDRLPDSYRAVLVLRDIEELDTEETARALGLTASAVKTRLHRARQALATLLAPVFTPDRVPTGQSRASSSGS
jgi:RNA polymerase sigma-70 factor (ECF subfamily)